MKRLLLLGVGSALAFTMGGVGPAQADAGPHVSTAASAAGTVLVGTPTGATRCAGCHRAHTAKASYLLKDAQPALCYSCHAAGMGAATDVKNGVSNNDGAALRSGGFESAAIGSGSASKVVYERSPGHWSGKDQVVPTLGVPVATTSNHQIDGVTSGTAWGNGVLGDPAAGKTMTLECGSCHDPHGNGNYRILKPLPNDAGTQVSHEILAAVVDNPTTTTVDETKAAVMSNASGISIPDQVTKEYTTTNYWLTGAPTSPPTINGAVVASPDGFIANVSDWCSTCHNRYLAKSGSWGQDSGDPTYTYRHTSNRIDKVGTRNCITCHVAHGSNAAMSGTSATFTAPDGTTPVKTSRLLRVDNRGTCVMCHNV